MTDTHELRTRAIAQLRRWETILRDRLRVIEKFNRDSQEWPDDGTRLVLLIGAGDEAKRLTWPADCESYYVLLARVAKVIGRIESGEDLRPADLEWLEYETTAIARAAGIDE